MDNYSNVTNFDQLVEVEHGKIGTESRNKYEENSQMFIISEMLKEARKEAQKGQDVFTVLNFIFIFCCCIVAAVKRRH